MKNLMKIFFLLSFVILVFGSCRNASQAKKAIEIARNLAGKTVKASKKSTYVFQYGDDVIKHIDFVTVSCTACNGNGIDSWGDTCEECEGDGYVYKIQTK